MYASIAMKVGVIVDKTFMTELRINHVRHLKDITIPLSNSQPKHLVLTGKNGSGKTSVLKSVVDFLTCNSVKNQKKYEEHIIDCCKEDPEASIRQELVDSHVVVTAIESTEDAIRTAGLLTECFEKENTGIRILECQTRANALQTTMTTLYRCLANYKQNPSQRNYRTLRGMLNRSHKFAGFTRTYVRNHIDEYPNLSELVAIA